MRLNRLNERIWYGIFDHNAYSVVAQKIFEDDNLISWAGFHIIDKYEITPQSYEFIQLSEKNKFCLVKFTIKRQVFEKSDGLNPTDFSDYVLFCFDTEDELYEICSLLRIDASKFTQKWHCEYPFD